MSARLQRHMDRLVALGCPREEVASVDPHKLRTLAAALTSFADELDDCSAWAAESHFGNSPSPTHPPTPVDGSASLSGSGSGTSDAGRERLWAAFLAGFAASSTGFNGEWPYEGRPYAMAADLAPVFDRWLSGGDRS